MTREDVLHHISCERDRQEQLWGSAFDEKNTSNDWIAYITRYAGNAVTMSFDELVFREALIKVAALCVAALERETYAARHYDAKGTVGINS